MNKPVNIQWPNFHSGANGDFQRVDAELPESTFHHFADYNWDPSRGSPDFVTETPGYNLPTTPRAMASVHCYVRNVALWLAGRL